MAVNDEHHKYVKSKAEDYAAQALSNIGKRDISIELSDYTSGSVDGWEDDMLPYGGNYKTTIGEYLVLINNSKLV